MAEIGSIIEIRDSGAAPCTHVDALLDTKLSEVRQRRQQLAVLEHELEQLVERSRRLDPADCTEGDICHILKTDTAAETSGRNPASESSGGRLYEAALSGA